MNHNQRGILGTVAIALIAAALFYIPWRIESNGKLAWAPFYRNPVMERSTIIRESIDTRFVELKGQPVWWLYGAQLIVIMVAGTIVFQMAKDETEEIA